MSPYSPPPPSLPLSQQQQQQRVWFGATLALPRQAVIIPGEAALTQRGAPVGNRLALQNTCAGMCARPRTGLVVWNGEGDPCCSDAS